MLIVYTCLVYRPCSRGRYYRCGRMLHASTRSRDANKRFGTLALPRLRIVGMRKDSEEFGFPLYLPLFAPFTDRPADFAARDPVTPPIALCYYSKILTLSQ